MRALMLAILIALALPGAAVAQVADALREDPVYVDPRAELAGEIDADRLRELIRSEGAAPMYIAVLPADGDPDEALRRLHAEVGLRGTYAIVSGRSFRAGSTIDEVAEDAGAAAQEHPGDIQAALEDFIGRVGDKRSGGSSWLGSALVIGILGIVGVLAVRGTRESRRRRAEQLAEVKTNVRDDLVALGDDIRALELDVQMPDADPAAKEDYAQAVAAYERANRAFMTARSTRELAPAAEALDDGRYAIAAARERLAGREPPERRPPCFFDPRHGLSARDVEWAPPGGVARLVPACEADAQRVERGEDPPARELTVDGRPVPYWEAGPAYAPFYGAFFPGLLVGSMMAGGWDAPVTHDWGGDFGGGDFGGGDFGGFGGGDF